MKALYLIIPVLLLFSCNDKKKNSFDPKKTESEVRTFLTDYFEDIKQHGLTAEFNYLDTSSSFFWIPPGYDKALNYTEVEEAIRTNAKAMKGVNNQWEILKVFPLTNEIAAYNGIVVSGYTDTAGKTGTTRLIEAGTVVLRQNGWKLLSGHTAVLKGEKF